MASLWGFRPRGEGLCAPQTAAYYATRKGISTPPVSYGLADGPADDRTTVERTDYRQDGHQPGDPLHHPSRRDTPSPDPAPCVMGRTTRRLVAAEAIGDFFDLIRTPDSAADPTSTKGELP